jgi:hypothetical protein
MERLQVSQSLLS